MQFEQTLKVIRVGEAFSNAPLVNKDTIKLLVVSSGIRIYPITRGLLLAYAAYLTSNTRMGLACYTGKPPVVYAISPDVRKIALQRLRSHIEYKDFEMRNIELKLYALKKVEIYKPMLEIPDRKTQQRITKEKNYRKHHIYNNKKFKK